MSLEKSNSNNMSWVEFEFDHLDSLTATYNRFNAVLENKGLDDVIQVISVPEDLILVIITAQNESVDEEEQIRSYYSHHIRYLREEKSISVLITYVEVDNDSSCPDITKKVVIDFGVYIEQEIDTIHYYTGNYNLDHVE